MGIVMRCDWCGKEFEGDLNRRVTFLFGETAVFSGFICDECSQKFLDFLKGSLSQEQRESSGVNKH